MLSKTITFLALASGIAAQNTPPGFNEVFGVQAHGDDIPAYKFLTASEGRIFIGGTQSPICEGGQRQDFANLAIYSDGTVFLWKTDYPPQQLWVDASGMGQGITGYTSDNQTAPRNASRGKFAVDNSTGSLTFEGTGAKACPTTEEGKWSVWFTTSETPGFQEGCVNATLEAYAAPAREISCTYSSSA